MRHCGRFGAVSKTVVPRLGDRGFGSHPSVDGWSRRGRIFRDLRRGYGHEALNLATGAVLGRADNGAHFIYAGERAGWDGRDLRCHGVVAADGPDRYAAGAPAGLGQSARHFLDALCEDEPRGSLDQCEVREGLREVPEMSAGLGVELLRIQPERGCDVH
jgi:hypothetical protein